MAREITDGKMLFHINEKLDGLYEITPNKLEDDRGHMSRIFDLRLFDEAGLAMKVLQESKQYTKKRHTIRGLHIALPPHREAKTVSAIKGRFRWIAVDVRRGSRTFGKHVAIVLDEVENNMLFARAGFAHGGISLTDDCALLLRADTYFAQGTGIHWKDKDLGIDWNIPEGESPIIRERDDQYPSFKEFVSTFGGV